jgi:hypothetical protein
MFILIVLAAVTSLPASAELLSWPTNETLDRSYETGGTDELIAAGILASIGAGISQYAVEDFFYEALEREPSNVLAAHSLLVHCARTINVPLCASDTYLRKAVGNDETNGGMWVAYAAMKHRYAGDDAALPVVRRAADAAAYDSYFVSYMALFNDLMRARAPLLPTHHQQLVIGFSGRSTVEVQMYGVCQSESGAEWTAACLELGQRIEESSSMPTMVGIGQKLQISMLLRGGDSEAARVVEQRRDALMRSLDAPNPSEFFDARDPFWYELTETQINDGELAGVNLIRERVGDSAPRPANYGVASNRSLVDQIAEGLAVAAVVKARTAEFIVTENRVPANREEAGMTADPEDNRGEYVQGVGVVEGQIVITYGRRADERLHGLTVVLTPYVSDAMSLVWQCGYSTPPPGLVAIGEFGVSSSMPPDFMPGVCLP